MAWLKIATSFSQQTCGETCFISDGVIDEIKAQMLTGKEFGGSLKAHKDGSLKFSSVYTGEKRKIMIPVEQINFHTHPNGCLTASDCSLGTPSATDMEQIYKAYYKGNRYHIIFSLEGTYVISVQRLYGLKDYEVKPYFENLQKKFSPGTDNYDDFVRYWLQKARDAGYLVEYFPIGTKISFKYLC